MRPGKPARTTRPARLVTSGRRGPQSGQIRLYFLELRGSTASSAAARLRSIQCRTRRRPAGDHDVQPDPAQLGAVPRGQRAQLDRRQAAPVPGQVGQSPPAADQRVSGPLGDHRGQRRRQPPAEPHQHGRPPRQRPGPGQRGDRLAAQIQRGGQLAGHQVSLHGGGRSPRRGQPPRRTTGRGQVVRGQAADGQPRLGGDQQAAGPAGAPGLLPVGVGRGGRSLQRLLRVTGQQGQLGHPELGVGGHHRGARRGQLLDRLAGRVGRLGQQPQFHQPVGVVDVVLAQRQPGGLVLADGLVEVGQPLDEPAGLNRDPGPRVDHVRDQMRPDLPGQRQGLVQAAQRGSVPALLALDHGQVVRHLDLAPEAEPGAVQ